MPALPPAAAICGAPLAGGTLAHLPQVEMSAQPLNDLGRHELILRVVHDNDRYCFIYTVNGVAQTVAPVIHVHRGETFAIRLVNEISGAASGATMAAHALAACSPMRMAMSDPHPAAGYLNHTQYYEANSARTPDDVNLHLHGFQGPASQENVFLSTLSTPAHACEYIITIPKTQPVGTYFYHPHAHGMSNDEVGGGLSGMWVVDPESTQIAPQNHHDVVLQYAVPVSSDNDKTLPPLQPFVIASMRHEQQATQAAPVAYDPFNPPAWPSSWAVRAGTAVMPECGVLPDSLLWVNGAAGTQTLTVPAGQPQLLRLLNATADSFERVHALDGSGGEVPLNVVGRDGVPLSGDSARPLSRFIAMRSIELSPTNRADVVLTLTRGQSLTLSTEPNCFSVFNEHQQAHALLTITAGPSAGRPARVASIALSAQGSPVVRLLSYVRTHRASIRRRAFTYTEYVVPNIGKNGGHGEFYITQTSNVHFNERPFRAMYANGSLVPQPDVVVKRGTIEEWYLFNATLEPHTFHIHQMAFAAEDEVPQPVMLDTVLVPVGTFLPNKRDPDYPLIKPGLTRVVLDFRNVPRGTFVFHCHMLFHEDRGMMGIIKVE